MRGSLANFALLLTMLGSLALMGCRKEDMSDQPKFYRPYKQTEVFPDGTSARPIPAGTIARGHLRLEEDRYTGQATGADNVAREINYIPIPINSADLVRGQQKFTIYCAVCHGALGDGQGMIVQRGFAKPPSLVRVDRPLTQREVNVQRAPIGHYFRVMTEGLGFMYSYNDRVAVDDRWRIAAYIRALQLSQDADLKVAEIRTAPAGNAPVPVQANPDLAKLNSTGLNSTAPNSAAPTTQNATPENR